MAPKLALSYNSQAGPGVAGPGWSISGYSIITRGPMNLERDGVVAGARFDSSDALYLDGARLIPVERTDAYVEYRPEIDDYSRVRGYGHGDKGHENFTVWTKAGLILSFGKTADSRPMRQDAAPFLWMCNQIQDTLGNYITFTYELFPGGDYNLKRVDYTGNAAANLKPYASVEFDYQALKDIPTTQGVGLPITTAYVAGEKIFKSFRLNAIRSQYGDQLLCRYDLGYTPPGHVGQEVPTDSACGFRLYQLTETASDGRKYNPTVFKYTDSLAAGQPAWATLPQFGPPDDLPSVVSDPSAARVGVHYAKLNADATEDLIYASMVEGKFVQKTYFSTNGKWEETQSFKFPIPLAESGRSTPGIIIRDINNDAQADVLIHQIDGTRLALINGAKNWEAKPDFVPPIPLGSATADLRHFLLLDLDGDKDLDLIWNSTDPDLTPRSGAYEQTATGWKALPAEYLPPAPLDAENCFALEADVDADGDHDVIYFQAGQKPRLWLVSSTGFEEVDSTSPFALDFVSPTHEDGIQIADINGTPLPELIASYRVDGTDVSIALSATAAGWQPLPAAFKPPLQFLTPEGSSRGVRIANVDGDSKMDMLVHTRTLGTGNEENATYVATPDGWSLRPELEARYPLAFLNSQGVLTELPVFLPDAQGIGRSSLIYQTPVVGTDTVYVPTKAAFTSSGSAWLENANYSPPVMLAQQSKPDLGVRFVDINADGLADLLVHYQPKDGNPNKKAYFNTASGWVEAGAKWELPLPISKEDGKEAPVTFIDVNGDARADALVHHKPESGDPVVKTYINSPGHAESVWQDTPSWHVPIPISQEKRGEMGARFADINGDGLTDILASFKKLDGKVAANCWLNTGKGWQLQEGGFSQLPAEVFFAHEFRPVNPDKTFEDVQPRDWTEWQKNIVNRDTSIWFSDLNGDRLPDLCYSHEFVESTAKTKADFDPPPPDPDIPPPPPPDPNDIPPLGMYRLKIKHNELTSGALINTGSGWRNAPEYSPRRRLDTPWGAKSHYYEPQDVNADGLTDIVHIEYKKDGGNQSATFLNTGRGWEAKESSEWKLPNELFVGAAVETDGKGDHGIRLMDINGDGMIDILQSYRIAKDNTAAQAFLNNGMSWVARPEYISRTSKDGQILPMADKTGGDTGVHPVDVNGDLIADLITWKKYEDGTETKDAYLNQSKRRDILLTVTNGMGFQIQFDHRTMTLWQHYKSDRPYNPSPTPNNPATGEVSTQDKILGDFYNTAPPGSYPILPAPPPVHAVETVRLWEPDANGNLVRLKQSLRYRYGEFRVNSRSGMPLGFGWRTVINEQNGMSELTRFEQTRSPYLVGTTKETRTAYNKNFVDATEANPCPGTPQSHLTNSWNDPVLIECLPNPAGKPHVRAQIGLASAKSELFDLDGTKLGHQIDSFDYDSFGNATRARTVRHNADGSLEGTGSETVSKYDNDTEKWFLGRLSEATATLWNENEKQVRTSSFGYDDGSGLLNREISFAGHPKAVTVTYRHDIYGNKIATKTSAGSLQARSATVQFDPKGRFAVESINALGHKSIAEYDPVFGNVISATDPNGVTARSTYDSHGAVTSQTSPTGIVAKSSYRYLEQPITIGFKTPSRAVLETVSRVGTLPESRTLLDSQGRTLRTIAVGEGGKRIYQDTEYDDLKRPYRVSISYFEGTKPSGIHWSTSTYEEGTERLLSVTSPDNGIVRYEYKGLTTTVTDKLGRTTTTEYNLRKLPLRITDPIKGVLRYAYDVGDRLTKVTNADGTITRHVYDDMGQRTETFDPDLGHWRYSYNAFNELTWQQDAKGQVTTLKYDVLGRPTVKQEADRWTTWEYDTARHGLGKLRTIKSGDRYSETYEFDGLGRTTRTTVTVLGETFSSATRFDEYNRAVSLTYPTGFQIQHEFDDLGFMRNVRNTKTSQIYWKGLRYNEYGQVAEERLGNGILTTHAYNRKTGYLDSIAAKDSQGLTVQNLRYSYDLAGNVKSRQDGVQQLDERFSYDTLDRLTSTSVNGRITQALRYGITGTILSKSDVGTYTYGDRSKNGPAHAVTSIARPDGGTDSYKYDANGNLVSSPTITNASYTASNLTSTLAGKKGVWSEFKYSPSGQKYWQEMRDGQAWVRTLYLGLYERIQEEMVPPWMPTNERLRHRYYITSPSGTCAIVEDITEFYPVRHSSRLHRLSPRGGDKNERTTRQVATTVYLHSDAIGSVSAISDVTGKVIERMRYDPWGKRIPSTEEIERDKERYYTYKSGFTGHDHLDNLGLVHMGGRVFDPSVALFTRADPFNQCQTATNCYNRYLYCLGNPLKYTDPTGYKWKPWKTIVSIICPPLGAVLIVDEVVNKGKIGKFLEENWKPIAVAAVGIGLTIALGPAGAGLTASFYGSVLTGAIVGGVSAGLNTALYGGSFGEVMDSVFKGAALGAASAAAFYGVGSIGMSDGSFEKVMSHGLVGGGMSEMQGGDFWTGFGTAGATQALSPHIGSIKGFEGAQASRVVAAGIVGGTVSVIGGGKFANGALIGAFSRMFNDELHFDGKKLQWLDDDGKLVREYDAISGSPHNQSDDARSWPGGPIPEGEWNVPFERSQDMPWYEKLRCDTLGCGTWPGGTKSWGEHRAWLEPVNIPNPGARNLHNSFTIHGGTRPGSAGCIDLTNRMPDFARDLKNHGKDIRLKVKYK
jgi:RHS repeat-associated protein